MKTKGFHFRNTCFTLKLFVFSLKNKGFHLKNISFHLKIQVILLKVLEREEGGQREGSRVWEGERREGRWRMAGWRRGEEGRVGP